MIKNKLRLTGYGLTLLCAACLYTSFMCYIQVVEYQQQIINQNKRIDDAVNEWARLTEEDLEILQKIDEQNKLIRAQDDKIRIQDALITEARANRKNKQYMNQITIEESAADKLKALLEEEDDKNIKLRIFVEGGGCSGFQYGFTFDDNTNEDDFIIEEHGVTILVDSMSMQYLQGSNIGYKKSLMGEQFEIKNPNATSKCGCGSSFAAQMAYSDKVLDHYENPRNVGSLDKSAANVGTGMVGAPACGDVMKLQIQVGEDGVIEDAKFKTYGCGSAIASSSLVTEWLKGKTLDEATAIKNSDIAEELALPPVKIHCSVLAEDAIKAAIADLQNKQIETAKCACKV